MFSSANSATTGDRLIPVMDVAQTVRRTIPAVKAFRAILEIQDDATLTPADCNEDCPRQDRLRFGR